IGNCPGNRTMAINGHVISGPDPGAVPGASTGALRAGSQKSETRSQKILISDFRLLISARSAAAGAKQDRRTCKGGSLRPVWFRRYRANRTGANDNEMALAA